VTGEPREASGLLGWQWQLGTGLGCSFVNGGARACFLYRARRRAVRDQQVPGPGTGAYLPLFGSVLQVGWERTNQMSTTELG